MNAILVPAVLAEQFDLQQQIGLVGALPAQDISLREQGEQIAASCLADQKSHALSVGPVDQMEWQLVVPNQCANLLPR